MSPRSCLLVVQVAALLALSISAALLVDHLGVNPAYCQADSGCVVARDAARQWFGPLPLPWIGLVGFAALLGLTLAAERKRVQGLLFVTATLVGTSGLLLLVLQAFVLKRFCPWCVCVDLLAIGILVQAWLLRHSLRTVRTFTVSLRPLVVVTFALIAVTTPVVWPHFRPAIPVPAALLSFQEPGRTTLVEFVDLQCAHCKALYPTLERLRREFGSQLHVHRLHVPSSRHSLARQAARLLQCVPTAEQSERLERALFEAPLLTEKTLRAAGLAVNMTELQMDQCWSDRSSERIVQEHIDLFHQLGRFGLPTTFIGGERVTGAMPAVVYSSAIARVRRPPSSAVGQAVAFFAIVLLLLVTSYIIGNKPARSDESKRAR